MSNKRTLGIGLLVYIIANVLMIVFYTIGILFGIFKSIYKRQFINGLYAIDNKLYNLAIMKDQTGNIVCEELFDELLINSDSVNQFGDEDETISSVLGKNLLSGKLSNTGAWIADILDSIQKDHCINSINK